MKETQNSGQTEEITETAAEEILPRDADPSELHPVTGRKKGAFKRIMFAALFAVFIIFALLTLNEIFALNDELPTWDSLFYTFGLRSLPYTEQESGTVSVHFIDVGQGDCALIRTGKKDILIDCGEYDRYTAVSRYLKGVGVTRLDSVIMSHPHSDHMGCMYRVVRAFGADRVIKPDIPEYLIPASTSSYTRLKELLTKRGIPFVSASPGTVTDTGGVGELTTIAPVKAYDDLNDFSLVNRYTYGDVSFLFTGDIGTEAESDILSSGADISADVIKVPHHGSGTSGSRKFVQSVSPKYAVFCVGSENEYGHPHKNVVDLYETLGAQILRTDMNGDIVFVTDGKNIEIFGNDGNVGAENFSSALRAAA